MNAELKPGMMALVIGAANVTSNTGKIVEIDSFIKAGDKLPSGNYAGIDCILAYGDGLAVFSTTSKAGRTCRSESARYPKLWPTGVLPRFYRHRWGLRTGTNRPVCPAT